ncbi:polysaccharide biosynthesis protein [Qipengyuania sp. YIM B01966]|uniref:polysaccharide biosynthesis protein n=1 Tax=Qipengyuania sp. YIM B01966 TaxID=2778646 RepID=UPI0018F384AF|nr:nucleoside-diphosphate sugar epimerase/dehydratase [Qipengyuania sp. YIM B01966]
MRAPYDDPQSEAGVPEVTLSALFSAGHNQARRLLNSSRGTKRLLAVAADVASCFLAAWLAFSLRLGVLTPLRQPFLLFALFQIGLFLLVFFRLGVYTNIFRFSGPKVVAQLFRGSLIITALSVASFGLIGFVGIPRTVSVIFPIIFFLLVATNRLLVRLGLRDLAVRGSAKRVLIYGAGEAARKLGQSLDTDPDFKLLAYASENSGLVGQRIESVEVINYDMAERRLTDGAFDLVLLALPSMTRSQRASLMDRLRSHGVHVQTLPAIKDIVDGAVSFSDLREIDVADLLARDPVEPMAELMSAAIRGKTVLVTGAGGSIGSELCRQIIRQEPATLVLVEMTESSLYSIDQEMRALVAEEAEPPKIIAELSSVANKGSASRMIDRWRPHTIYHAAAYKHVPIVEINPIAGVSNNVMGTLHCALAARQAGVERFILVSTDKAVRPTNVMGASKRVCEMILQALAADPSHRTIYSMVRFGNVLGSSGSVVPQFKRQIAAGGPVTVTHRDITRFFMTIPEAAELVIQAGSMAEGGELYLLDMGEPVRIRDLAASMITLSGYSIRDAENPGGDIEIVEVGLRPGEKLYEELLIDAEATPTGHPQIYQARETWIDWDVLVDEMQRLETAIAEGSNSSIIRILHDLVPGYSAPPQVGLALPQDLRP